MILKINVDLNSTLSNKVFVCRHVIKCMQANDVHYYMSYDIYYALILGYQKFNDWLPCVKAINSSNYWLGTPFHLFMILQFENSSPL